MSGESGPGSRPSMSELGARMREAGVGPIVVAPWQRRAIEQMQLEHEMRRRAAEFDRSMQQVGEALRRPFQAVAISMRQIARAFRVPMRLLAGAQAERERQQVRSMQRWARRRGRRKGRA